MIEIKISTKEQDLVNTNHVITGDKNFEEDKYLLGISFAEEMIEVLSLPFVNYVFASPDRASIEKLNNMLTGVGKSVYDTVETNNFSEHFSAKARNYFIENISSLVFNFGEQDIEGINQIIRLPYYHGLIDDIVELNFV